MNELFKKSGLPWYMIYSAEKMNTKEMSQYILPTENDQSETG